MNRQVLVEWTLRSFAIAAYLVMLLAVFNNWRVSDHPYSLLILLVTEAFTLGLIVFAHRASRRDASPLLIVATLFTSSYFLLLDIADTGQLVLDWAGAGLQSIGLGLTLVSKAALGRSFGVLPAVRGLVTHGPYQFVRHPVYLGYLLGDIGFLLEHVSFRNMLVIVALFLFQVLRIGREELVYRDSELRAQWDSYCTRVRFRLVPFVY